MSHVPNTGGISRRGFLCGAGAGLAVSAPAAWLGLRDWRAFAPAAAVEPPAPADGMPGPFPGRVVEVHDNSVFGNDLATAPEAVTSMVARGMRELTGAEHVSEAWRRFFQPGDVVGLKVNPVGRAYRKTQVAAISSPALIVEVVAGLKSAGVRPQDIILFERYADQFREAGYEALCRSRPLDGVRWYAAAAHYSEPQLDIEGYDGRRNRDAHVVGYDPDVFVPMGFCHPDANVHHPKDDRRFRSHLSMVVSHMVNKVINLPVLKDHGSAGVTLALKNLSHGCNNNVARSHLPMHFRAQGVSGPNQCNTFIPMAVGQPLMRQKTTLHILDGLVGVYQGGPSSTSGCVWRHGSLFFATDPVALDHVGWEIVDAKRIEKGLPAVAQAGMQAVNPGKEAFDRRQPEHIILAGSIGLGTFDAQRIEHRRVAL